MRRILVVAVSAACFGVAAAPAAAGHRWNGYHWARTANPFALKLGDNVTAAWDTYLMNASNTWSRATVLDTTVVAGQARSKTCRPTSGRVEVCNGAYGNTGWLGVATIWLTSGSHITQGTVKVNDTYFNLAAYSSPEERDHTMCQEVGHTLGLGHTSEDGSDQNTCMDYSPEPESNNRTPNQHDYDELAAIYSHLDSFTTVGSTQAQNPSGLPYRVDRADNRRETTITEHFFDGSKRVTHITWAA
jgi:hypothetical protein